MKTGCDVIQAQEEVVKNKEAELENTRKQLKEKSEGLSLKEAEFIDLEKVNKNWHEYFFSEYFPLSHHVHILGTIHWTGWVSSKNDQFFLR